MSTYQPSNYIPGYNPCLEAAGYTMQNQQPQAGGNGVGEMMPGMMPGMMPAMLPNPATMCPAGAVPYTVEEGNTLYSIARMYGSTVSDILAANPGLPDMNMLYIGQTICVPIPKPCHGQKYTIMAGDTFYSISRRYGITVAELMAANPGVPANGLMPGMDICIPMPTVRPCPTGSMTYTVTSGDTLTSIADRFSVSIYALTVANPGFSSENLMPGMRLCIAPFACGPACVESERYTLGQGEDLMTVAAKYSVSTDDLLRANPFAPPCYFVPGNSICLPVHAVPITQRRR